MHLHTKSMLRSLRALIEMDEQSGRNCKDISDAIEAQPDPPCDDDGTGLPCEHREACGRLQMACTSFEAYTKEEETGTKFSNWITLERNPTVKIFARIYKED